jgi:hypothetical protein
MLTLISALLIKLRVNFRDVNYHYFSPQICDTWKSIILSVWRSSGIIWTLWRTLEEARFLRLTRTFRDNCTIVVCILELYSVKINSFLFSTKSFLSLVKPDALISFILKFHPLSRVDFLYWEANLPSNRVNLSRVNFKYVNKHEC